MRHFTSSTAAAVIALGALIPFGASGQGSLTITNYQLVTETKISRTVSDFAYRADVFNTTGQARPSLTATVTSSVASTQVIQGSLHFTNVPANGQVTSTDTFTIRVDRSVVFDFANLHWTFSQQNPIANAGPDQSVVVGATVTLNGSGSSNPSGVGTLTYSWAFSSRPAGSAAVLANPTSVSPTFVPDVAGPYNIVLTVSNGTLSDSDSVLVTAGTAPNTPPVANAGPAQTVPLGSTVHLTGAGSTDADGDPLTYSWTFVTKPAGSTATLTGANTVSPTFVADKSTRIAPATNYIVQLVVNDGKVNSNPATVVISTQNSAPVANAGSNQTVQVLSVVQLNGAGSTDADGDPLTYSWSLITRPANSAAALSSTTAVNPTFTADKEGTYVAQLIVNDGQASSAAAMVTITTGTIQAPTANAGANQSVHGGTVTLHGSGTDPQNFPLTFQWSLSTKPAGSNAVLTNPTSATPTFVADVLGTYVAQLIVNNGFLSSAPATVTITDQNNPPVANAGPNQTVQTGATVTLTGAGTTDADNDPITFAWSFTTRPAGSSATLTGATTVSPTFVADVAGTYVVQLIASDPFQASAPVTVTITATTPQAITLSAVNVGLGASVAFPVTLPSPAPAGGTTVTLVIADPTKASLSTLSVAIAAGATTPATQPQATGVGLGLTNVTASATGFAGGNGSITVTATATLTPTPLTIIGTATQNLTLTLSAAAPAGGVTFTLNSSTPATATVPGSATITQGNTTVSVPVTGVAAGSTTISATAANVTVTPATVNVVQVLAFTTTSLPNGKIGTAYSQSVAASGGTQPYTFAITSGTLPGGLNFNTSNGQITGTPTGAPSSTPLTFKVTDSGAGPAAQTATKDLTLVITVGDPATITVTGGDQQSAFTGAQFASPLQATVKDPGGNPVPNVTVAFTVVPVNGAGATFAGGVNTATTNASGVATSAALTANATPGAYSVSGNVTPTPVAQAATFSLANVQPSLPADSVTATGGTPQAAFVNAQFGSPLVATAKDINGQPVAGVVVTFNVNVGADNQGGTFAGGVNTAVTNALGVATSQLFTANGNGGSYTVTATAPGVVDPAKVATFKLANAPIFHGTTGMTLTNVSVGQNLEVALTMTLPAPAPPGGVKVYVTSLNPSLVLLGGALNAGTTQVILTIPEGSTTVVGLVAQAMAASGTVQLSAAASGFENVSAVVTLTPSGFVLDAGNGIGTSLTVAIGGHAPLTVSAARLDTSLNFAEVQQLRGGFSATIPLSSSDTNKATVSPASVTINGGDTSSVPAQFTAITNTPPPAFVVVTAGTPAGYSTPNNGLNQVHIDIGSVSVNAPPPVTVGQNLEEITAFTFTPAPANLIFTLTSNDPSKLLLSLSPTAPGEASITFNTGINPGHTSSPFYYVHGLVSSGSATYSISAPSFGSATGTVNFATSAFALFSPFGLGQPFLTFTGSNNTDLTIESGMVDGGGNLVQQFVRGGLTVNVPVVSSNTTVGTITTSPVVFTGGTASGSTQFHPLAQGTTTISITAPSGFGTIGGGSSVMATVNTPNIRVSDQVTIGKGLQNIGTVFLGAPAPAGGVAVTLTSNSPNLKLSLSPTTAGSSSLPISIPAGGTSANYYIQALTDTGNGTYTGTATGFNAGTGTISFSPSGVVIYGPFGPNSPFPMTTTVGGGPQAFTIATYRLFPGSLATDTDGQQQLAGGSSLSVSLTNSNPAAGTVPSPVTINGGSDRATPLFTPLSAGTTTISVIKPAAFSQPSDNTTLTVNVNP